MSARQESAWGIGVCASHAFWRTTDEGLACIQAGAAGETLRSSQARSRPDNLRQVGRIEAPQPQPAKVRGTPEARASWDGPVTPRRAGVAAVVKTVFVQETQEAARKQWRSVADNLRERFASVAELMDTSEEDVLAYMAFPKEHWTRDPPGQSS